MGWRGTIRAIAAAQRRMEQEQQRRSRFLERQQRLQAKINEIERTALELEDYEERIRQLLSVHHSVGDSVSWEALRNQPEPLQPKRLNTREVEARRKRAEYKPSFFVKLFRKEKKIRERLDLEVIESRKKDDVSYEDALKLHVQQVERWQESRRLSEAILAGDLDAYRDAVLDLAPLAELEDMGCETAIKFPDRHRAEVDLQVESESVIPRETKSATRTGKLSVKPMPQRKFYELYQDYVCGCALRAARELFSFLPLRQVIVNIHASILDTSTGLVRPQTVLSVVIPKQTIEGMVFKAVDPSDAMKLFVHRMGFKRSEGFYAIKPLVRDEYPSV